MDDQERLVVLLEARVADFEKRMKKAEGTGTRSFKRLRDDSRSATQQMEADMKRTSTAVAGAMAQASTSIGTFGKAFVGGLVAGGVIATVERVIGATRNAVKAVASLGDEAKRAGLSARAFQEWKFVAEQNRIGIDQMVDGFKELNLRADEFIITGAGAGAEAFARLGFSSSELAERLKDPSELMLEIVDRLEGMDRASQIRISDEIFGGSAGERFVELLAQGDQGLRKTIATAHELGAVLSDELIESAAELDRKFAAVETRIGNFLKREIVTFATSLEQVYTGLEALPQRLASAALAPLTSDHADRLAAGYEELTASAQSAANAMANASLAVEQAGNLDAADEFMILADAIEEAMGKLRAGEITAAEFSEEMVTLNARAEEAVASVSDMDGVSFGGTVENLAALGKALIKVAELAAAAKAAMPVGPGQTTGTGLTVDDIELPGSGLAPVTSPRPQQPGVDSYGSWEDLRNQSAGGSGGGGGGGEKGFARAVEDIARETAALQAEAAALLGVADASSHYANAADYARTKAQLLVAAQEEGIEVTPALEAQMDALARSYVDAGMAAEDAAARLDEIKANGERGAQAISDIFMSVATGAMTAKEALAQLLLEMAKVMIQKAFMNLAGGGGAGGGFFGMVGSLLSLDGGGYTGNNPRSGGLDGKGGFLAMMHPQETVIDHTKGAAAAPIPAARAMPAAQAEQKPVRIIMTAEEGPMFRPAMRATAESAAVDIATPMVAQSARQQNRDLQGRMDNHQARGTR